MLQSSQLSKHPILPISQTKSLCSTPDSPLTQASHPCPEPMLLALPANTWGVCPLPRPPTLALPPGPSVTWIIAVPSHRAPCFSAAPHSLVPARQPLILFYTEIPVKMNLKVPLHDSNVRKAGPNRRTSRSLSHHSEPVKSLTFTCLFSVNKKHKGCEGAGCTWQTPHLGQQGACLQTGQEP